MLSACSFQSLAVTPFGVKARFVPPLPTHVSVLTLVMILGLNTNITEMKVAFNSYNCFILNQIANSLKHYQPPLLLV